MIRRDKYHDKYVGQINVLENITVSKFHADCKNIVGKTELEFL